MHFHLCGNPFHDVPMLLSAFVAEVPMLMQVAVWLRAKLSRPKTCGHAHSPYRAKAAVPRQPRCWTDLQCRRCGRRTRTHALQ